MIHFLSVTVFPLLMIVAGAGDALAMRIPNWLTGLIAAAFLPMALLTAMPLPLFGLHLAIGAAMFAVGFVLFAAGLFGGGDAKLLAAAGLWLGWPDLMPFLVMTAFAGGVLALAVGCWSMVSLGSEIRDGSLFRRFGKIKPNVPYGYAFAVGAILAFPQSWWMPATG
ncbi:MAG: prepilin peptidase [Rhizobiales bacterium]|nr:prepilin peptidase [Hyphomicrobiales bacterium]MBI3673680.1 prepilin peptidase [Hyphomicrobiales bacterium]